MIPVRVLLQDTLIPNAYFQLDGSLSSEQIAFGNAHVDKGDDINTLSMAVVGSDLPEDYYPGRFGLLSLGVHWRLKHNLGFMFSGLGHHGGTAPLAPPGEMVQEWATRMLIIGYTPTRIVDGSSKWAFAALPQGEVLYLAPEMIIPEYVFLVYSFINLIFEQDVSRSTFLQ